MIFDNKLTPSEEPLADIGKLCNDENYKDSKPKVMINVIKENPEKKSDMEIYSSMTVFKLFPKVGSTIFEMGKPDGGYWDMVI